jgi:ABC-type Fe2+-enterobactin transport system substrate-binding protein
MRNPAGRAVHLSYTAASRSCGHVKPPSAPARLLLVIGRGLKQKPRTSVALSFVAGSGTMQQ